MVKVKICGITNIEDAKAAAGLGVDMLGFIFAPSPRRIEPVKARDIICAIPPFIKTVGVFVDEDPAVIKQVTSFCGLDMVQLHGDELTVEATQDNFAQKKHNLIQTMLAVNDLWTMTEPMVASLFREDVERYLREHQIRFTPSVKFTGKSGLDHSFDFAIPASLAKPERILNAISNPTRQNISLLIFSWTEIAEVRPPDSTAYGVLNDTEKQVSPDLISALQQYRVRPMQWSRKDEYVEELAV